MNPKISVCIIGYNEENKVEDCLKSVQAIADEIVFVDSISSDKTVEIVKKYTDNIILQKFLGHVEQKQLAVDKAKNDWVLCIDCDERLSNKAINDIQKAWEEKLPDSKAAAFSFHRLTYYVYRWIKHSGWYPDTKIRLFNRRLFNWQGINPHDRVDAIEPQNKSKVYRFNSDILHYSFDSISDHLKTIEAFSEIGAKEAFEKGKKSGFFTIIGRSFWAGFRKMVFEAAWRDGMAGIILTGLSMAATWSKYSKLYIMNKQKQNPDFTEKNKIHQ